MKNEKMSVIHSIFSHFLKNNNNYNMLLTPQFEHFSPLDLQALYTWEGVNSATRPWPFFFLFFFIHSIKIPKQINEMNIQNNYLHSIPFSLSN